MFTALVIIAAVCIFLALTAGLSLAFRDEEPEEIVRVEHHPLRLVRPQPYDWMDDDAS
jgi:hypothetical protein